MDENTKYSISIESLNTFGDLCRIFTGNTNIELVGEDNYYFQIKDMWDVLDWAYKESIIQKELIDQLLLLLPTIDKPVKNIILTTSEGLLLQELNNLYLNVEEE